MTAFRRMIWKIFFLWHELVSSVDYITSATGGHAQVMWLLTCVIGLISVVMRKTYASRVSPRRRSYQSLKKANFLTELFLPKISHWSILQA